MPPAPLTRTGSTQRPAAEVAANGAGPRPALLPQPVSVEWPDDDAFEAGPSTRVVASAELRPAADLLARLLRRSTGFPVPVSDGAPADGDIRLALVPAAGRPVESYRLRAGRGGVTVEGASPHGVFNGVQTLRQLFPTALEHGRVTAGPWTVPAVVIDDAPAYEYRGVMLDIARSFLPVADIKAFVDALVPYKMNRLHLHLTDDQGWRIEITNDGRVPGDEIDYTLLTSVSGRTAVLETGYLDEPGRTGFLSQRDYAEIVRYAAERHVVVVPEIDMPGHVNAALHAIPALNTPGSRPAADPATGTAPPHTSAAVGGSTFDTDAEVTYTFVEHVLRQLATLTPGPYLHVGGDESRVTGREGYQAFVGRVLRTVRSLGKTPVGWNEYAQADLAENDVVQYWVGEEGPVADRVRDAGARLLVSPASRSYVNLQYDDTMPIGRPWAYAESGNLRRYYSWDPAAMFPAVGPGTILGVEAPLFTETVRGLEQALFLTFPRALAVLEVAWTPRDQRSTRDFVERVAALGPRHTLSGVNLYAAPDIPWHLGVTTLPCEVTAGATSAQVALVAAPGCPPGDLDVTVTADGDGGPAADHHSSAAGSRRWAATIAPAATEPGRLHLGGAHTVVVEHEFSTPGWHHAAITVHGPRETVTTTVDILVRP